MARDGADERSVPALGTKAGVDRPERALGSGFGADPHQLGRELVGRTQRAGLGRVGRRRRPGGFGDEEHVDVTHVVELVTATLAHADDGDPAGNRPLGHPGAGNRECGLERGGREIGELGGHVVDRHLTAQVAGGEAEQMPLVRHPQRVGARGTAVGGDRFGRPRIGTHRLEQRGPQSEGRRPYGGKVGIGELVPVLRVPGEVLGQARTRAQHPKEPVAQGLVDVELGLERRAVGRGVGDRGEVGDRLVGVGAAGRRLQEDLRVDAETVEGAQDTLRLGEPHPRQLAGARKGSVLPHPRPTSSGDPTTASAPCAQPRPSP